MKFQIPIFHWLHICRFSVPSIEKYLTSSSNYLASWWILTFWYEVCILTLKYHLYRLFRIINHHEMILFIRCLVCWYVHQLGWALLKRHCKCMRVSNIQISSVGLGNTKHENVQFTQYKMILTEGGTPATHKIQILYLNLVFIKFMQNTSLIIIIINWRAFKENTIFNVAILAQWIRTPFLWVMCWSWCERDMYLMKNGRIKWLSFAVLLDACRTFRLFVVHCTYIICFEKWFYNPLLV